MAVVSRTSIASAGWLRGRPFDTGFIVGTVFIAIASGWIVARDPKMFPIILFVDVWLLGYHHVISTYTRLCFDAESIRENRFLLFGLPPLVLAGVAALYFGIGAWTIPTIYLYWQWFHYTRQSYGVSQAYRRKAGGAIIEPAWLTLAVLYLVPLWGILFRSNQAPDKFLGLEIAVLPVPDLVVVAIGALAITAVGFWAIVRILAWRQGYLAPAHTLYVVSHLAVFFVGYIAITDIDYGWLVINVWHNAQYILFVWLYNTNRFSGGIDPKSTFLSTISQAKNWWLYFFICFAISTVLYLGLYQSINAVGTSIASITLIVFMTLNFHHYLVDGLIWKMRRKKIRQTLGLAE